MQHGCSFRRRHWCPTHETENDSLASEFHAGGAPLGTHLVEAMNDQTEGIFLHVLRLNTIGRLQDLDHVVRRHVRLQVLLTERLRGQRRAAVGHWWRENRSRVKRVVRMARKRFINDHSPCLWIKSTLQFAAFRIKWKCDRTKSIIRTPADRTWSRLLVKP